MLVTLVNNYFYSPFFNKDDRTIQIFFMSTFYLQKNTGFPAIASHMSHMGAAVGEIPVSLCFSGGHVPLDTFGVITDN